MKIKYWLMLSYLMVMLLPLAAIYMFYTSLSKYDDQQSLKEYLEFQHTINGLDPILQDPSLYKIQTKDRFEHLNRWTGEELKIEVYRGDGVLLYTSMGEASSNNLYSVNKDVLYRSLNEVQKSPTTYSVKKPVFDDDNQIAGIYEIISSRTDWVDESNKRSFMMIIFSSVFFFLLYIVVLLLINRKLNQPLKILQEHMNSFANGEEQKGYLPARNDEIGELMDRFEQMKGQIIQSRLEIDKQQQEKELMVASLSHDLKTPLTVIRTYAEALESNELTAQERKEYQRILFQKLDHMKNMIDDLAIFTALQSSQNKLKPVIVNGNEFFDMVMSGYEEPCLEKNISLITEKQVKINYQLDPKQFMRIIDNLMENSIRHTPEGGKIWFGAIASQKPLPQWIFSDFQRDVDRWRKDGTVILIQNEGKGIGKEEIRKVFTPFYQGNPSRGKGASSGLGLSIAKMLMEQHGGKINIWSLEEGGTLIACWLKEG